MFYKTSASAELVWWITDLFINYFELDSFIFMYYLDLDAQVNSYPNFRGGSRMGVWYWPINRLLAFSLYSPLSLLYRPLNIRSTSDCHQYTFIKKLF